MRLQIIAGALAFASSSVAFSDASPFALLSTSPFSDATVSYPMRTMSETIKDAQEILGTCPTDRYLVISQPGATTTDIRGSRGCAMPNLCRAAESSSINGKYIVSEVVGDLKDNELVRYVKDSCLSKGKEVTVDEISLSSLSRNDRVGALEENDAVLRDSLDTIAASDSYSIIFYATQGEPIYESEFDEPVKMNSKRRTQRSAIRGRDDNDADWNKLPLFEKYQFFTPGIFMGLIAAIVLFSILGVGLKALSSLEVSYGAFEKDMGPAAQKKQQ
ncbi:hypothetical protein N3K66_008391 [Trichothecium roseum]|uniref:Uncharacterized protein n=1 Tax=Trichothecium roseum TaxID=47278 RepID=A0ACC0URS7_9HYPO|nr:hypothetical protein N3K66_008391 [Trichothecium roseum]